MEVRDNGADVVYVSTPSGTITYRYINGRMQEVGRVLHAQTMRADDIEKANEAARQHRRRDAF